MEKYKQIVYYSIFYIIGITLFVSCTSTEISDNITIYPENNEKGVPPDAHLKITFKSPPTARPIHWLI